MAAKASIFYTSWWFYGSKEKFDAADKSNLSKLQIGTYYQSLGKSNQEIAALNLKLIIGAQTPELLRGFDRLIVSPGISPKIPILQAARELGLPIQSEIDLALSSFGDSVRGAQLLDVNRRTLGPSFPEAGQTRCTPRLEVGLESAE